MKSFKKFIEEDGMGGGAVGGAPANAVSSGAIAGVGYPPGSKFGEPGVYPRKKKTVVMGKVQKRKPPKI